MVLVREVRSNPQETNAEHEVTIEIALMMVLEAIQGDPQATMSHGSNKFAQGYEVTAKEGTYKLYVLPSRHQQRLFERLVRVVATTDHTGTYRAADVVSALLRTASGLTCSVESLVHISRLEPSKLASVVAQTLTGGTRVPIDVAIKNVLGNM